jgi:hypothetical protein
VREAPERSAPELRLQLLIGGQAVDLGAQDLAHVPVRASEGRGQAEGQLLAGRQLPAGFRLLWRRGGCGQLWGRVDRAVQLRVSID